MLKSKLMVESELKILKVLAMLGANIFVAGSAIFKTESYKEAISKMKQEISAN